MIPKTAISIKLRAIPLSAGLSRASHKPIRAIVGHHIKSQPIMRSQLTVEPDKDLENEIKNCKGELEK